MRPPRRLRQNPRARNVKHENPDDAQGAAVSSREESSSRGKKRSVTAAGDGATVEAEVIEVGKLTAGGWTGRWKSLMAEHHLSGDALVEMLINAYDACTCRIEAEKKTTEQDTSAPATTLQTTGEEKASKNSPSQTEDKNPAQVPIKRTFTCIQCDETFAAKSLLVKHITNHAKNMKSVKGQRKTDVEDKMEQDSVTDIDSSDVKTKDTSATLQASVEKENEAILEYDEDVNADEIVLKKQRRVGRDDATGEVIGEIVVTGKGEKQRKIRLKRERNLTCEHCGKTCSSVQTLKFHLRTHTGERPIECATCGKRFIDYKGLQVHSRIHSGVRPYACPHCDLTFTQSANLKRHVASVHDRDKQFLCQYCDARFARLEHLKTHERSHLGVKPFICIVCGQEFSTKQHLQRHAVVHTGFLPYSCSQCPRAFARKDRLLKHEADHAAAQPLIVVTDPILSVQEKNSLTCCIMKKDDEEEDEEEREKEKEPEPTETTPQHILKSIRRVSQTPTPKSTPKIRISRDPSGRSDPVEPDPKRPRSESTNNEKSGTHDPANHIPSTPQSSRLKFVKEPNRTPVAVESPKRALGGRVAPTFTVVPSGDTVEYDTAASGTAAGGTAEGTEGTAESGEQTVEYITYEDTGHHSQQALLDAVLAASQQQEQQQQQQHAQQHPQQQHDSPQQQVVYYKQLESGNVVELSPGSYSSVIEPVLYQQEVEVAAEPSQQQVYVVQEGGQQAEGGMIITEGGAEGEQGVQYVFQTE